MSGSSSVICRTVTCGGVAEVQLEDGAQYREAEEKSQPWR